MRDPARTSTNNAPLLRIAAVVVSQRGFGCRVLARDRCRKTSAEYVSLDVLLQESDGVTLHLPLTADTHSGVG